jgi:hypothetical protein
MSSDLTAVLTWIAIAAVSPLLGYRVGKIASFRARTVLLLLLLVAPLLLLTAILLFTPTSPPGFFAWWNVGALMMTPEAVGWCFLCIAGFLWGRTRAK